MSHYRKHGIPTQTGRIKRLHLTHKLTKLLDYRITLLSAPPGCGKTTLAAQSLEDMPCDVVWHTITRYQQDMPVIVSDLLTSLSHIIPDIKTLSSLIEQAPEVIAHRVAQVLAEVITQPLVLVLDNWEHFASHHPANQWLRTFINFMPDNCHVFLLSQTIPPLEMLTLIARREILAIDQEDLYFTQAEVHMLANQLNSTLTADAIDLIWQHLAGWAAGTILALQPGSKLLLQELGTDVTPSDELFQSIAREMLSKQAPEIQKFLRWTAIVDRFDSTICGEDVLRLDDWQRSLAEVNQKNLFIQEDGTGYKYHTLFRNFLQTNFKLSDPEAYAEANRRVASWYERQSKIDKAVHHYLEGNYLVRAQDLIEELAHSYFIQGRTHYLQSVYEATKDLQIETPNLFYVLSRIALNYANNPALARTFARRALTIFKTQDNIVWQLRARYQLANITFYEGDYAQALAIANDIIPLTQTMPELRGLVLVRRGVCHFRRGDATHAIDDLEQARPLLESHSGWLEQSYVLQEMDIVYRELGNKEEADDCLIRLVALRRSLNNHEHLAIALNNLGYQYYIDGDYHAARNAFKEGLETVRILETSRSRAFLLASLADLERDCGRYDIARDYYNEAQSLIGENEPYVQCEILTHLATLYRWQGRFESALTSAFKAKTIAEEHHLKTEVLQANLAVLLIRLQPYNLRTVREHLKQIDAKEAQIEMLVLSMCLEYLDENQQEETNHVINTLRELYHNAHDLSLFFAELINNPQLIDLKRDILAGDDAIAKHLKRLDDASTMITRRTVIPIEPPTSSIEVYTLGAELIRRDGQRIPNQEWQSTIAREIFFYLVIHSSIRREDICLMYWQDKSADAAYDLFHKAIARIRQVVGSHTVIYDKEQDLYLLNPDIYLFCDVLQVNALINEGRKLSVTSLRSSDVWAKATHHLSGDFLPEYDRQWVTELRSHYDRITLEAWMQLGRCHQEQHHYHAALNAYNKAIAHNPLHEDAYRSQMRCWSKLGERAEITFTYDALYQVLQDELGIYPSAITETLLDELLN